MKGWKMFVGMSMRHDNNTMPYINRCRFLQQERIGSSHGNSPLISNNVSNPSLRFPLQWWFKLRIRSWKYMKLNSLGPVRPMNLPVHRLGIPQWWNDLLGHQQLWDEQNQEQTSEWTYSKEWKPAIGILKFDSNDQISFRKVESPRWDNGFTSTPGLVSQTHKYQ